AKGFGLAPFYDEIPPQIRGYVELVYDLNNNASYRLIEPLLYESEFYDARAQSLMLSLTNGDDRPFVLSTPRLEDATCYQWNVPFESNAVDQLFKLKYCPKPWGYVWDLLGAPDHKESLCRSFFTEKPPALYCPYTGDGVRWRYFGHACILIETKNVSMLFDPVLSYTYEAGISRYTYDD